MTIPLDLSQDWDEVEDLEDVVFYPRIAENSQYGPGVVTKGKRMPLSKAQVMSGNAQLTKLGIVWHLWTDLLEGKEPKHSDKIVAGGYTYLIANDVEVVSLRTRRRCTCLRDPSNVS